MAVEARLLDAAELGTLGGAVLATVVVTNGLCYAFGWSQKYVGLVVSLGVSVAGAVLGGAMSGEQWVIAVLNGFVIYSSAVGVASIQPPRGKPSARVEESAPRRKSWWPSWW